MFQLSYPISDSLSSPSKEKGRIYLPKSPSHDTQTLPTSDITVNQTITNLTNG